MSPTLRFLLLASLLSLLTALGCQEQPATTQSASQAEPQTELPASQPIAATKNEESWEAHYIGGDRVGYSHTSVRVLGEGKDARRETHNVTELTIKRFGQTVSQTIEVRCEETLDGAPLRFQQVANSGAQVMSETSGEWRGDELHLRATTLGKAAELSLAWKPEYGGPFADTQTLRRDPLEPGETRSVTALIPSLNQLAEISFAAKERETVKLLEGSAELLRVEAAVHARTPQGVVKIASTYWVDDKGEVQKTFLPQLNQTSYRTTKERATAKTAGGSFDLADATIVKLAKPLTKPHDTSELTYRATLASGEIKDVFVAGPSQHVTPIDERVCEVTVHAIRPGQPKQLDKPDTAPTAADLAANTLVQSDDERVVLLAHSAAEREEDPWKIALALEKLVHESINEKNFSQTFATAAEVARTREGDCTEHAVLLAAVCRARKVPARCAMGLVYYPKAQGFAYHMWTEVWIDDRWVPLDATLGRGGIGAGHLKLAHSNLKGADAYSAFLPVFRVLGQLKLEVVAPN